jgi:flavin-dependent dehydrogenase
MLRIAMPKRYDAIVIGGGPAGSTTALMLARAGWAVALIEKSQFPRSKVCGEFISASTFRRWRNGLPRMCAAGRPNTPRRHFLWETVSTGWRRRSQAVGNGGRA